MTLKLIAGLFTLLTFTSAIAADKCDRYYNLNKDEQMQCDMQRWRRDDQERMQKEQLNLQKKQVEIQQRQLELLNNQKSTSPTPTSISNNRHSTKKEGLADYANYIPESGPIISYGSELSNKNEVVGFIFSYPQPNDRFNCAVQVAAIEIDELIISEGIISGFTIKTPLKRYPRAGLEFFSSALENSGANIMSSSISHQLKAYLKKGKKCIVIYELCGRGGITFIRELIDQSELRL